MDRSELDEPAQRIFDQLFGADTLPHRRWNSFLDEARPLAPALEDKHASILAVIRELPDDQLRMLNLNLGG